MCGRGKLRLGAVHPGRNGGPHVLLERGAEGAVAVEPALESELLGGEGALVCHGLMIQADEVADAQPVDVGVVRDALLGEVLAQIVAVRADGLGQIGQGEVMLQVELLVLAMLFQEGADVGAGNRGIRVAESIGALL